ncbi:MAG: DUF3301 domain-containing protein [Pseudazoarcus pumilus]|nr:DUF3301 domain-containing protein [Pseudazoarcus pumilus]
MLFETVSFLALCLVAWFWLDSVRLREIGIAAARRACEREGVQLLDDTVAFRSLRPVRNDEGQLTLRRVYEFEYSGSGDDRQRGSVVMVGREVVLIDVGARRPALHVVVS